MIENVHENSLIYIINLSYAEWFSYKKVYLWCLLGFFPFERINHVFGAYMSYGTCNNFCIYSVDIQMKYLWVINSFIWWFYSEFYSFVFHHATVWQKTRANRSVAEMSFKSSYNTFLISPNEEASGKALEKRTDVPGSGRSEKSEHSLKLQEKAEERRGRYRWHTWASCQVLKRARWDQSWLRTGRGRCSLRPRSHCSHRRLEWQSSDAGDNGRPSSLSSIVTEPEPGLSFHA